MSSFEGYQEVDSYWYDQVPSYWGKTKNKYVFCQNKHVVGENWEKFTLLTMGKSGVKPRDMDGGGKFPASFETYQTVEANQLIFCLFDLDETPRTIGMSKDYGMITSAYDVFSTTEGNDPQFWTYFYQMIDDHKGLRPFYTGLRKVVRSDTFMGIEVFSPPLEEQKLISRYLDKKTEQIDSLINKIQQKIELLKEQRTSLINQCVTKGLDPNVEMKDSGVEWIDEIPKHWRQQSIKHVLNDYFGGSWGEDLVEGQTKGVVQVVRVTEFDWNTLSVSEKIPTLRSLELKEDSKKLVRRGDLVIEKSGGGEKTPVGRVILIDRELTRPTVNSNFTNIFRPNQEKLDPGFGVYLFYTSYVGGMTIRNVKQTTGIQNLDIEGFLSEKIFLPPKEEQEQIQIFLDNSIKKILHLVRKHTDQLKLLTEYRQSLISSVVTGKVCVTEDMI